MKFAVIQSAILFSSVMLLLAIINYSQPTNAQNTNPTVNFTEVFSKNKEFEHCETRNKL